MTTRSTEDAFLAERIGKPCAIFLINGLCLRGILKASDSRVVLLKSHDASDSETQMIFATAISTIVSMPLAPSARKSTRASTDPLDGILTRAD